MREENKKNKDSTLNMLGGFPQHVIQHHSTSRPFLFIVYSLTIQVGVSPTTMGFTTKNDHDLGCEMGVPPFKERPKAEVSEILAAASANSQPPGSEEDKLHPLTLDPGWMIFPGKLTFLAHFNAVLMFLK